MRRIIAVGDTNAGGSYVRGYRSVDLPAPSITVGISGLGGAGWILEEEDGVPITSEKTRTLDIRTDEPAPTGGDGTEIVVLMSASDKKPPYRVPLMTEIAALQRNGYKVVSTFSGCGGTCLGYKMDGYDVVWANEFIPAAQETYRANHGHTILDCRDIRTVQPEEILQVTGLKVGELDVFEGSPPCASFSMAGKRDAGWGKPKPYSDTVQRVDDLFFEYTRLLRGLRPKVFTAENVSGLVKGVAKGYFKQIYREFLDIGYVVEARLLDAQWLGVPQARQRIIFVGVRRDLAERYGVRPTFPKPLPYRYSVRDALPWIVRTETAGPNFTPAWRDAEQPAATIVQSGNASFKQSPYTLVEAEVVGVSTGDGIRPLDVPAPTVQTHGRAKTESELTLAVETRAVRDNRGAFGNGGDITDEPSPTVAPYELLDAGEPESGWDAADPRARQVDAGDPAPSVLTHGRGWNQMALKAGQTERRKFTIAELRRICGFPDDFVLTGTYAQQWERLGRSVPPAMAYYIARAVREGILDPIRQAEQETQPVARLRRPSYIRRRPRPAGENGET